jgi:hypothetical protein
VLAFRRSALWRPQSRQISTARLDRPAVRIRGLPPGDYYLAYGRPSQQGEWFEPAYPDEHRSGAVRLLLGEGDVKTRDRKVSLK